MEFLSMLVTAALVFWCFQLRRRINEMDERLELVRELELRVLSLEKRTSMEPARVVAEPAVGQAWQEPTPEFEVPPEEA